MNEVLFSIMFIISIMISFGIGLSFNETPAKIVINTTETSCDYTEVLNSLDNIQEMSNYIATKDLNCGTYYIQDTFHNPFEETMRYTANMRDYKANLFDCTEFSDTLAYNLEQQGFKAKRVPVTVDCDDPLWEGSNCKDFEGRHDIVRIDTTYWEATIGQIIMPENYDAYGIR